MNRNAAASRLVLAPFSEELVKRTAQELLREVGGEVTYAFVFISAEYRAVLPDFWSCCKSTGTCR